MTGSLDRDLAVLRKTSSQDVLSKYFGGRTRLVRDAAHIILTAGEPTPQNYGTVEKASQLVLETVVYWPLDPYLRDFSLSFARVLRAWAQQKAHSQQLGIRADVIERILLQNLTILDAVALLRRLIRRLEPLASYTPPSFQLARHYLDSILDTYKRGSPINKYEEKGRKAKK